MKRCQWAGDNELMVHYHDHEWGVAVNDERLLFEFLTLEGAQAGLSWITILKRREHYRAVFDNLEPEKVAAFSKNRVEELLGNSAIIRNRGKIESVISNARIFLEVQKQYGSFYEYIWSFVNYKVIQNYRKSHLEIPAHTTESCNMSKSLKKLGFKFVGPTICYAFMQAVGMVNDHTIDCFRHQEILKMDGQRRLSAR